MKGANLVWAAIILVVAVALFLVKYEVQRLEAQLLETTNEIARQEQEIHVLKAEWTYLNDPERLLRLSKTHLGLVHLSPKQIVGIDRLPEPDRRTNAALDRGAE